MTTREALERSRQQLRSLTDIPGMSDEKAQALMSKPSATFISHKKPEEDLKEKPKTSK